jgi:hypothetical protein
MKITLTGCKPDKKIWAIKAVRAATGMALKEAKDTIDLVAYGNAVEISVAGPEYLQYFDEGQVTYVKPAIRADWNEYAEVLSRFPADMTVGELRNVFAAIAGLS